MGIGRFSLSKFRKSAPQTDDYQYSRFPQDQYALVSGTEAYREAHSTLEIGCNAGLLVKRFQQDGKFAVGVEKLSPRRPMGAVLSGFRLEPSHIERLPKFDLVFALSVHHQWFAENGEEFAGQMVVDLYSAARQGLFLEFAATNAKYGRPDGALFHDNDATSVRDYASRWLSSLGFLPSSVHFLGSSREAPPSEPFRFMFMIDKPGG